MPVASDSPSPSWLGSADLYHPLDGSPGAHPECSPEVVAASDFSGSTAAMIRYVEEVAAPRYLLLTECSMGDNIAAANPHREMLRLCTVRCPHMNEITLELTLASLEQTRFVVDVPEEIRLRALGAVERMLAIG